MSDEKTYEVYVDKHPYMEHSLMIYFSTPRSDNLSYHVNEVLDINRKIEKFRNVPMGDELLKLVKEEIVCILKEHANSLGFTSYQSWLEELDKE